MQLINATLIRHQERQRESRKEREQRGGGGREDEVGNSIKGQQYFVGISRETVSRRHVHGQKKTF